MTDLTGAEFAFWVCGVPVLIFLAVGMVGWITRRR